MKISRLKLNKLRPDIVQTPVGLQQNSDRSFAKLGFLPFCRRIKSCRVGLSIPAQASHRTVRDSLPSHGSSYSNYMRFSYIKRRLYAPLPMVK